MNVIVTGQERFRIDDIVERRPYLVAQVDVLKSYGSEKPAAQELAETVAVLFGDYYRLHLALSNQWSRRIGVPGHPSELADFVASHLSVDARLKQRLLETLSVVRRLEMEDQILGQKIREFTSRLRAAQRQKFAGLSAIN
jgi:ATP-dependent Lon protease